MDYSETYIKMCCKAIPEINPNWKGKHWEDYEQGDLIFMPQYHHVHMIVDGKLEYLDFFPDMDLPRLYGWDLECFCDEADTWLPRQDQLQDMVGIHNCRDYMDFKEQRRGVEMSDSMNDFSMEAMWLMVVMKEKHSKTWDGEDWK